MATHYSIRKEIAAPEIPDKLYFRIGDVARLLEIPAYVLRFWETEFPQLKPNKGGTGQRLYRKKDVEMALRIKSLLYDQGFTIPGARQVFKQEARPREAVAAMPSPAGAVAEIAMPGGDVSRDKRLAALRSEMRSLLAVLSKPATAGGVPVPASTVKAMRPRLVLEPRAARVPAVMPLRQVGLFGFEDDPGPIAS